MSWFLHPLQSLHLVAANLGRIRLGRIRLGRTWLVRPLAPGDRDWF